VTHLHRGLVAAYLACLVLVLSTSHIPCFEGLLAMDPVLQGLEFQSETRS
jgi:hypothetical protein